MTTKPPSRHTPGPWHVMNSTDVFTESGARNAIGEFAAANDGWQIADTGVGFTFLPDGMESELTGEEQQANARLIAAAPDLLAALERLDAELRAAWDMRILPADAVSGEAVRAASDAIDRARGAAVGVRDE